MDDTRLAQEDTETMIFADHACVVDTEDVADGIFHSQLSVGGACTEGEAEYQVCYAGGIVSVFFVSAGSRQWRST